VIRDFPPSEMTQEQKSTVKVIVIGWIICILLNALVSQFNYQFFGFELEMLLEVLLGVVQTLLAPGQEMAKTGSLSLPAVFMSLLLWTGLALIANHLYQIRKELHAARLALKNGEIKSGDPAHVA